MPLRKLRRKMDFVFGETEHDSVRAGSYPGAVAADVGNKMMHPGSHPWRGIKSKLTASSQCTIHRNPEWYISETIFTSSARVYSMNKHGGELEYVGAYNADDVDLPDDDLQFAAVDIRGNWLLLAKDFSVSGAKSHTAYIFSGVDSANEFKQSSADLVVQDIAGVLGPTIESWNDGLGPYGFVFAEYDGGLDTAEKKIHWFDTDNLTHSVALNVSSDTIRHFHGLDKDPYADAGNVFYAHSGDSGSESRWYESTDFGQTWTEVAGGNSYYRTLRINFGPDYFYLAMDGEDSDGDCWFVRIPRDDLSSPEPMFKVGQNDTYRSYGSVRLFETNGVLATVRVRPDADADTVPLWYYDIDTEEGRLLTEFPTEAWEGRPGVESTTAYVDPHTRDAYLNTRGVSSHDGYQTTLTRPVRVHRLQSGRF